MTINDIKNDIKKQFIGKKMSFDDMDKLSTFMAFAYGINIYFQFDKPDKPTNENPIIKDIKIDTE